MPPIMKEPCLGTAHLRELIKRLPENVYVQRVTIEACRIYRNDIRRTETQMFETRQCYPNIYIPTQPIWFATPLIMNAARFDKSNEWENFIKELDEVDRLCGGFDFSGQFDLKDVMISDRLFIKDIMLLELPTDNPNYHPAPYHPADDDDKFYDGVRCSFASFSGAYQLLGAATQEERDGWLPGMTRKPLDLAHIEVVKTKHIRRLIGKRRLMAFHRGKEDIHVEEYENLISHPEVVKQWLPTLCEGELLIQREVEGDWKESRKFVASKVSLETLLKEEANLIPTKQQEIEIPKDMKKDEPT
jgi:hypothetical protein